jgi:hypothetical protein
VLEQIENTDRSQVRVSEGKHLWFRKGSNNRSSNSVVAAKEFQSRKLL